MSGNPSHPACDIEGCINHARSKHGGLCSAHMERRRRGRPLDTPLIGPADPFDPADGCRIEGCPEPYLRMGYCSRHYARSRQGLSMTTDFRTYPRPQDECTVPGCPRPYKARGMCGTHWRRLMGESELPLTDPITPGRPRGSEPITYLGAHQRIYRLRGFASQYVCMVCGEPAQDWAFDNDSPRAVVDAAGLRYSIEPSDYSPMCKPCHGRIDSEWRRRHKQ